MRQLHRITVAQGQCGGRGCARGLRVRAKGTLGQLAAGGSHEGILADFPCLEHEDITATLEFAARQSDDPILRTAWVRLLLDAKRLFAPAQQGVEEDQGREIAMRTTVPFGRRGAESRAKRGATGSAARCIEAAAPLED